MRESQYALLKMRHARAVAEIVRFAAIANRETAMGGWIANHDELMSAANAEAEECEAAIAKACAEAEETI